MPAPVFSFVTTTFVPVPVGTRQVSLHVQAPFPVIVSTGVAAFRKLASDANWTKLPAAIIDNSIDTVTPDAFDLPVQPGFDYAFMFKGTAMAVAPGANSVQASFGLFADQVNLLHDLGGAQRAKSATAGIVGGAFFRT